MSFRDLNHTLSCLFTLVLLAMNKEHSSYYDDAGEATSTLDVTTLSTLRDYGLVQYVDEGDCVYLTAEGQREALGALKYLQLALGPSLGAAHDEVQGAWPRLFADQAAAGAGPLTMSEFVAAAYLFIVRAVERRRGEGARGTLRLDAVERGAMFRTAAPIALLSVIIPLGAFFDTFIVVNALKWGGADTAAATAMYGLYCGPVTSLVNLPVAVAMALAVAVVPSVSVSRAEADLGGVLAKSRMSVKLVYLVGVPSALFLMVFGRNILSVLYPTLDVFEVREAARLLSVAAFGVVLAGSTQIYVSLLQALDRTKSAVKSLFASVVVKAVLSVVLVRFIGVMGAAVAGVVMSAVSLLLVSAAFHRFTEIRLEKNVAQTLVCGVIMALAALVVREYVPSDIGAVTVGAAVCLAVYGWLTMLAGVFTEQECLSLPFGSRLAKLRRKIRFWENGYDR